MVAYFISKLVYNVEKVQKANLDLLKIKMYKVTKDTKVRSKNYTFLNQNDKSDRYIQKFTTIVYCIVSYTYILRSYQKLISTF